MTDRLGDKIRTLELLNELTAILAEEVGYNPHFASQIAEAFLRGLRRRFRGQSLGDYYLAELTAADREERDAAIRAEFNGQNRAEVCQKYGISKSRLYEIVKEKASGTASPLSPQVSLD